MSLTGQTVTILGAGVAGLAAARAGRCGVPA